MTYADRRCPACRGLRIQRCTRCLGKKDTRYGPCSLCNTAGHITCTECGGVGIVPSRFYPKERSHVSTHRQ